MCAKGAQRGDAEDRAAGVFRREQLRSPEMRGAGTVRPATALLRSGLAVRATCLASHHAVQHDLRDAILCRLASNAAAERAASFSENGSGVVTSTSFDPSADSASSTRSTIRAQRSRAGSRCTLSAEMLRQHDIARSRSLQHIKEAREVLRHLEQPNGMAHGRGVHHDLVVIAIEQFMNRQQRRHLGHAGQAGVEQRSSSSRVNRLPLLSSARMSSRSWRQEFLDLAIGDRVAAPTAGRRWANV